MAVIVAIILAVLFALPIGTGASGYYTYLGYLIFLMVVLTVAWDFAGGLARLLSLGNAAFFGVGAYAAAIAVLHGIPMPVSLLLGGVLAAGTAVVLSVSLKLRGIYFIMSTLFLAEIMEIIMLNWTSVTGGNVGLYLKVPPNFTFLPFYYATLITALVAILAYQVLRRSWIGLALRAIGDDEDAARSLGVDPLRYKIMALLFSAFFTGVMGGVYANITLFLVTSDTFSLTWSINPTFAAIIGGVGTLWGGVIGGVIMALLSQELTPIGPISIAIQSAIMIVIIIMWPTGVYGLISRRLLHRSKPSPSAAVTSGVAAGTQVMALDSSAQNPAEEPAGHSA
jgi:branched-chain amino acid transport system permease protein